MGFMKKYHTIDHDYTPPSMADKIKKFAIKYLIIFMALMIGFALFVVLSFSLVIIVPLAIAFILVVIFFNRDHVLVRSILSKYKNK